MSDAYSESLKPGFWESNLSKNLIAKDQELVDMVDELEIIESLNGVNFERDVKPIRNQIMQKLLNIYGPENYYSYMFKDEWRQPDTTSLIYLLKK